MRDDSQNLQPRQPDLADKSVRVIEIIFCVIVAGVVGFYAAIGIIILTGSPHGYGSPIAGVFGVFGGIVVGVVTYRILQKILRRLSIAMSKNNDDDSQNLQPRRSDLGDRTVKTIEIIACVVVAGVVGLSAMGILITLTGQFFMGLTGIEEAGGTIGLLGGIAIGITTYRILRKILRRLWS